MTNRDPVSSAESGSVVLIAAALSAFATLVIWVIAQIGVTLINHARATTAADALALAAVVWQGADLSDLAAEHAVDLMEVQVFAPTDPMVDLTVLSASVTVRYRETVATARAMARELPLSTLEP
jgi:Zn-dependent alcohol dehydrogenase